MAERRGRQNACVWQTWQGYSFLLFIDFKKAFGSIEWPSIQRTLKYFNFGVALVTWFKLSYTSLVPSRSLSTLWSLLVKSQLTVKSRMDQAENAWGLGWSYTTISSCIQNNGWSSEVFSLNRGSSETGVPTFPLSLHSMCRGLGQCSKEGWK